MKILVAVATRHGSTREIADGIGESVGIALRAVGDEAEVEVLFTETVTSVAGYDAVVLGSAVYMGRWLESAKKFAHDHRDELRAVPVWLFSSGPVGEPLKPAEDPGDVLALVAAVGAREHRLFGGKIDKDGMRFAERAVVVALRVKEGDYRDWPAIRSWGLDIGGALHATSAAV